MSAVCRIVKEMPDKSKALEVNIPWAYRSKQHHDYHLLSYYAKERNLDESLIPFALFIFRGLCYSSYANNYANTKETPAVYLASPGRLSALKCIVSGEILEDFTYVKQAYTELLEDLELPEEGYRFHPLDNIFMGHEISQLTQSLFNLPPNIAFGEVLQVRNSESAVKLRMNWSERLLERTMSCSVGLNSMQFIKDATIHGDVNLTMNTYIRAVPYYGYGYTNFSHKEHKFMPEAKQNLDNVEVGGKATQRSDNPTTEQGIRSTKVQEDVSQQIASQQSTLKVFGGSATGKIAIIGLIIILLAWFLYHYLIK